MSQQNEQSKPTDEPSASPAQGGQQAAGDASHRAAGEVGIPDEALPADLVPGQDNPLAEGLPAGETAEGLLDDEEGKSEEETAYAPAEGTGTEGETAGPPPPEESARPQES
jgi:hypothetical protein